MIEMTLAEIARVTRGAVHGDPLLRVGGAAYVDSRLPLPHGLFVAIAGARTDGHEYDAHAVLGQRPTRRPSVVVPDPVVALGRLARHLLDVVRPSVVAVTASCGRTGTTDLLAHLLPGAVAIEGDRDDELGVPLTVLRAGPLTREVLLETGVRGVGRLSYLADVAPPTTAVVLRAGRAHLSELGSRELVAVARGELVEALPAHGTAVLDADDRLVAAMAQRTVARVLTFGAAGDVSWSRTRLDALGRASFDLHHRGRSRAVRLRASGAHRVVNAAAAAAAALAHGLDLDEVADGLSTAAPSPPPGGRDAQSHRFVV